MRWPLKINLNRIERENQYFDIKILCILEGELTLQLNMQEYVLNKDDIILVNSGQRYSWIATNTDSIVTEITIDYRMLLEYLQKDMVSFWCNSVLVVGNESYDELRKQIYMLVKEYTMDSEKMTLLAQGLYYQMIDYILGTFMIKNELMQKSDDKELLIQQTVQYINGNYQKKISLEEVAKILYVNPTFLSRLFKEKMQINFVDYIHAIRMEHVVQELLFTDKKITEIAMDNGYGNLSLFNRVFKKKYQLAPLTFRNTLRQSANKEIEKKRTIEKEKLTKVVENMKNEQYWEEYEEAEYRINTASKGKKAQYGCKAIYMGMSEGLLSSKMQKQVLILKKELGVQYLQISNVLSPDMELRAESEEENLNFEKTDVIFDFIVENKLIPIIELGEETRKIQLNSNQILIEKENKNFIENEEDGKRLLSAFIRHFIKRYGYEEVSKWIFQLLYESKYEESRKYNYLNMIKNQWNVIKGMLPECKFGVWGANIAVHDYVILSYLERWKQEQIIPDFIMIQVTPYEESEGRKKYIPYPEYIQKQILDVRNLLDKHGYGEVAIHINHWNPIMSDRNYINDTVTKAAITLDHVTCYQNNTDLMVYDYGSDITSVYYDKHTFLIGGKGLLSKDGLQKPVCFGLGFLKQLKGEVLVKDKGILFVKNVGNEYYVLLWRTGKFTYKYFMRREDEWKREEINDIFEPEKTKEIHLKLCNLKKTMYMIKIYCIDNEHANLIKAWEKLGNAEIQTKEETDYLKQTVVPELSIKYQYAEREQLEIVIKQEINSVIFIKVSEK